MYVECRTKHFNGSISYLKKESSNKCTSHILRELNSETTLLEDKKHFKNRFFKKLLGTKAPSSYKYKK